MQEPGASHEHFPTESSFAKAGDHPECRDRRPGDPCFRRPPWGCPPGARRRQRARETGGVADRDARPAGGARSGRGSGGGDRRAPLRGHRRIAPAHLDPPIRRRVDRRELPSGRSRAASRGAAGLRPRGPVGISGARRVHQPQRRLGLAGVRGPGSESGGSAASGRACGGGGGGGIALIVLHFGREIQSDMVRPQRRCSMGGTFQYLNPGTIHWGEGSVSALDAELSRAGVKRVFLITTGSIARNPALLEPVEAAVGARLVGKTAAIGQHAPVREVAQAAREVREAEADALSKSRSVRLTGKPVLPHFSVPTTLSVAELSGSAGFSAEGTKEKVGVAAPELVPKAAFYDAALAVHTPLDLWLSTGIRAVDHAVETLL